MKYNLPTVITSYQTVQFTQQIALPSDKLKITRLVMQLITTSLEAELAKRTFLVSMLTTASFFALSQIYEKRLLTSSCPSVRLSAWDNSAPTGQIYMKIDISDFENLSTKIKFFKTRQEQREL
jgi:hypothetical protein